MKADKAIIVVCALLVMGEIYCRSLTGYGLVSTLQVIYAFTVGK